MTTLLAHGMDDQKLPSSIIIISFNPSQMSCSFAADLALCCPAGAGATCTGDAALDPQFSWRLSGSGCGGRRWYVEVGAQEDAGAGAAAAAAAWAAGKLSLARWPRNSTAAMS